jgi:outer membrane protein assembly factor BamB
LSDKSLAGLAATREYVIVADRELADTADAFRCLRADTGAAAWSVRYPAPAKLDFGNSPRATPLIHDGLAFLLGATGQLHCVELATGKVLWRKDARAEFAAPGMTWGVCGSPLIADGKLILNPGGPEASLVALAPRTGRVVWKTPGSPAGYGSLLAGEFGGRSQVVGHDADSLGGWDAATGRRLWRLVPPRKGDFNVPTPLAYRGRLVVCTENNGTRLYRFGDGGLIDPTPVAVNADLAPDTTTPVVVGDRLFGAWNGRLFCLDLAAGLKPVWEAADDAFHDHVSLIASDDRLLAFDMHGELLLIDARADGYRLLGRLKVLEDESGLYAHPALVGSRLYLRGNDAVFAVELGR